MYLCYVSLLSIPLKGKTHWNWYFKFSFLKLIRSSDGLNCTVAIRGQLHNLMQRSWELVKRQNPIRSLLFETKDLYLLHLFLYTVNRWSYGVVLYEIFTVGRSLGLTDFCFFMGAVQLLKGRIAFISRMSTEGRIWRFHTTDIL